MDRNDSSGEKRLNPCIKASVPAGCIDMELTFKSQEMPVEAFKADLNAVCGSFDIDPGPGRKFGRGGVGVTDIAGVETALVSTDMQRVLRTSRNIRDDHNENCFLIIQEVGRALMIQEDRQTLIMPGDMVLIDSALPSEFVFFGDRSDQISLHLPRQDLFDRFGSVFESGLSISAGHSTAKAITAILEQGLQTGRSARSSGFLKESLFNLLGAHFFMQSQGEEDDPLYLNVSGGGPVLAQAIAIVDASFRDPNFTAVGIADDLGITRRQVQRAFQELSVTPTRYLMARRLEYARERLMDRSRRESGELISSIAYECGFSDLSYFNRRFREAFGMAPGDCIAAD